MVLLDLSALPMDSGSRPGVADRRPASRNCRPLAKGLLDRGMMRLDATHLPRLFFTELV